jgi:hypothetical protein
MTTCTPSLQHGPVWGWQAHYAWSLPCMQPAHMQSAPQLELEAALGQKAGRRRGSRRRQHHQPDLGRACARCARSCKGADMLEAPGGCCMPL